MLRNTSPCEITQFCTRHNDIANNIDFNGLTMSIKMLQFGSRRRNRHLINTTLHYVKTRYRLRHCFEIYICILLLEMHETRFIYDGNGSLKGIRLIYENKK